MQRAVDNARTTYMAQTDLTSGTPIRADIPLTWMDVACLHDIAREFERLGDKVDSNARHLADAESVRLAVETVLDGALGTRVEDGTGEGLAADVALVVHQRDEARAEVKRLNSHPWCTSEHDNHGCALLRGHDDDHTDGTLSWPNHDADHLAGDLNDGQVHVDGQVTDA